jgi:hypothetical protein
MIQTLIVVIVKNGKDQLNTKSVIKFVTTENYWEPSSLTFVKTQIGQPLLGKSSKFVLQLTQKIPPNQLTATIHHNGALQIHTIKDKELFTDISYGKPEI